MNLSVDQLAKFVLNKNSLKECSIPELQQLADQYPYFNAAQFLFLKKLKEENSSAYKKELQARSLFFQNPLWLNYLLDGPAAETILPKKAEEPQQEIVEKKEPVEIEKTEPVATETASSIKTEPTTPSSELTFEPYHTVDYFASQGIKFKIEEAPKDKFGQQLKSFTEWLKTLKKLPQSEVTNNASNEASSEKKVEQLAEHSIQDRNVVTEAMAEVWEKQGNSDKAIEIYTKLSLLDPDKSSYFAAKIEQLKKTS